MPLPAWANTSHSSSSQPTNDHQQLALRHGPYAAVISWLPSASRKAAGFVVCSWTRTGTGGRIRRSAMRGLLAFDPADTPDTEKPSMRKLPDRCVSSSTGEPTRSSPAIAFKRAIVTSNRDGSGVCGAKSPSCTLLD